MRQTANGANRGWLTVLAILLLLAGVAGIAVTTGWGQRLATRAGVSLSLPKASQRLFGSQTRQLLHTPAATAVVIAAGVVLFLLGLWWLIAQIPRSNPAKPFRLHDDAQRGLTRCAPSVLTDAVEQQIRNLPGVEKASAVLRGTAAQPELTLKVTAGDRTDIADLVRTIQGPVSNNLSQALDTQLSALALQLEVDAARKKTNHITL